MTLLAVVVGILTLVATAVGAYFTWLAVRRRQTDLHPSSQPGVAPIQEASPTDTASTPLAVRLLSYFWDYPVSGGEQSSWAIKESSVLRGQLQLAKDKPGLGAAIVSTELALDVFGDDAASRIDGCVKWALAHRMPAPPHLIYGEKYNSITSQYEQVPDFRHTLAFAVVLARTHRLPAMRHEYVRLALTDQSPVDGGWPAGDGATISELFTVAYALELLYLSVTDESLTHALQESCQAGRDRAAGWLIKHLGEGPLWRCPQFQSFLWGDVFTTAWLLHRLSVMQSLNIDGWRTRLHRAADAMIEAALRPGTWSGSPEAQRFRVESRVAASAASLRRHLGPPTDLREKTDLYLAEWNRRASGWFEALPIEEWDLSTVIFMLDSMHTHAELQRIVHDNRPSIWFRP